MKKIIVPFLLGVVVSFYFFPVTFRFLPVSLNSKVLLAIVGAFCFVWSGITEKSILFSKEVFFSACIALLFSASCYMSVLLNGTNDMTYATYFVSFFTWLAGAYAVCVILKMRYNHISIHLLTNYLMWVCVAQCVAAILNDNVPAFKSAVCTVFYLGEDFLDGIGRKYGIGAALDPGGVRFAIVLVLIAHDMCTKIFVKGLFKEMFGSVFAFFFIILFGSMISRTTSVGGLMGLAYIFLYLGRVRNGMISNGSVRLFFTITSFLILTVPIVVYLYNTSPSMHLDLRFAFEGFFNWVETGEWRTDSTDKLNSVMWVWPEDMKTWLIGSGLFSGFVYSTDIGYCRFILYCGLVGFGIFSLFFVYNASAIARKFNGIKLLSFMLLVLTFVIWIKVATDIFQIYALLFCIDAVEDEDNELLFEEEIPEEDDLDRKLAQWAEDYVGKQ